MNGYNFGAAFDRASVGKGRGRVPPKKKRFVAPPTPPPPGGGGGNGGGGGDAGDDDSSDDSVDGLTAYEGSQLSGAVVGGFWKTLGSIAKGVATAAQGVVSLVPGIGTGISAAIGAGMSALEGGSPLDIAVNAAFGAIPIPPGAREIAKIALDAALSLVHTHDLGDAVIAGIRGQLPAGLPQKVFDTLAHIVLAHIHKKPTMAVVVHQKGKPSQLTAVHTQNVTTTAPTTHQAVLAPTSTAAARVMVRPMAPWVRGAWVMPPRPVSP